MTRPGLEFEGSHLWGGGVRGAPGSLAPGSTLAVQLLGAMLPHSLQQQVVDGGEVVVAAALQRLRKRRTDVDISGFCQFHHFLKFEKCSFFVVVAGKNH